MEWAGSGTLNVNGLIPDRVERGVVKSNLLPSNISSWNVNEPKGKVGQLGSAIGQNEHRVGEVPIGLNDVEQCPFIRASTRSGGATGSDELLERASHERFTVPEWSFGPRTGEVEPSDAEEELARAVCLSAIDVPASSSTFLPPLDTEIQVRLRAIDSSETTGAGTVFTEKAEPVAVALPSGLASGRWIVDLSTVAGPGTSDTPIVIDIEE